jgi:hypothetical protein
MRLIAIGIGLVLASGLVFAKEVTAEITCVWQLHLAHFGSLIWPTLMVSGLRSGF